jgi:hypothetical protein
MLRPRSAPHGPRRRRRGGSSAAAVLVGGLAVLLILGAVGGYAYMRLNQPTYDVATMCPTSGPSEVQALLIDRSDPISPLQTQRLEQILHQLIDDGPVNERIDLYILTANGLQSEKPVVSLCRPPSGGNYLTQNPAHIHAVYVARFVDPIQHALAALTEPSEMPDSPIMESIKAVCIAAFGGLSSGTPTGLTVVSDMIQNSPVLDQYHPYNDSFFHTAGMSDVTADCHQAKVDILYLLRPRDARIQTRDHELFWEQFFDHMNAVVERIEPI